MCLVPCLNSLCPGRFGDAGSCALLGEWQCYGNHPCPGSASTGQVRLFSFQNLWPNLAYGTSDTQKNNFIHNMDVAVGTLVALWLASSSWGFVLWQNNWSYCRFATHARRQVVAINQWEYLTVLVLYRRVPWLFWAVTEDLCCGITRNFFLAPKNLVLQLIYMINNSPMWTHYRSSVFY